MSDDVPHLSPVERRWVRLAAGPAAGVLVYALLSSSALAPEARTLAGVLAGTVVWWVIGRDPSRRADR